MTSFNAFERFVRASRRRAILLRVLERGGVGVFIACGFAGVLMPIWIWRESDAFSLVIGAVSVGLLAGLIGALSGRPSVGETLARADEQFHLNDLLGTAWTLLEENQQDSDFAKIILARADARCRSISPSELALNHYGRRAWSMLGLVVMLVFTVALMADPSRTAARSVGERTSAENSEVQTRSKRVIGSSAEVHGGSSEKSEQQRGSELGHALNQSDATNGVARTGSRTSEPAASDGAGGGSSGTDESSVAMPAGTLNAKSSEGNHSSVDFTSAGALRNARQQRTRTATVAARDGLMSAESGSSVAPWKGEGWSEAKVGALDAVPAGRVPDAYRDVVRDYFNRGDDGRD